jgi:hypothetical protein
LAATPAGGALRRIRARGRFQSRLEAGGVAALGAGVPLALLATFVSARSVRDVTAALACAVGLPTAESTPTAIQTATIAHVVLASTACRVSHASTRRSGPAA